MPFHERKLEEGLAPPGFGPEPPRDEALRVLLRRILPALVNDPSLLEGPGIREVLEEDLPSRLLETLDGTRPHPRPAAPHLRMRALRRALAHIAEHPHDSLGVQDLCRSTGASERTLRRAFTEELGVGPKTYLQALRLNGVYRGLREGDPSGTRVNDIAHRWGFWHMGQFAADYRRLFAELPTRTLRKRDRASRNTARRAM